MYYLWNKSHKRPCLIQNVVQNEKPKNWRLLILRAKNCHHLRPTVNEKKTNDDYELVGLVLEKKSTAHNLNETSRSSINFETSEFDFLERKTKTNGNHFQMICQKVNNMIQPNQNFQFILGDFMEMMKLDRKSTRLNSSHQ